MASQAINIAAQTVASTVSPPFIERVDCLICGSNDRSILQSVSFMDRLVSDFLDTYYSGRIPVEILGGNKYEVRLCNSCGFIWQGYVLNERLMTLLYEEWISAEDSLNKKRFADASLLIRYAHECEVISRLFTTRPFQTDVLDYGMGWGYWCRTAKAFGFNVTGFEVSNKRVDYARKLGIDSVNHLCVLLERRFDFINCDQVLEHVPNPRDTLKDIESILKPCGVIRIAVPDGYGIKAVLTDPQWKAAKDCLHPLEHINCFTHETLVRMGVEVGLELREIPQALPDTTKPGRIESIKKIARKLLPAKRKSGGTVLYFQKSQKY